eukprot:5858034-Alexandrium_andersonii.AAC.1
MTGRALGYFAKAPTRVFLGNRGLANVVYLLGQQFGAEDQDTTRSALGKRGQFHRNKNQSMEDFTSDFDIIIAGASYYGLILSDID